MRPTVAIFGLASDYGCQVQITNAEDDLPALLGALDIVYWQLASSASLPEEYDVAIIEGAVTIEEHVEFVQAVRETAKVVVAIGACAVCGGIPALAGESLDERVLDVYGRVEGVAVGRRAPRPLSDFIAVDYTVPGCPIDAQEFLGVVTRVLLGLSDPVSDDPLCASCKVAENVCFFDSGEVCLGVVTRAGCGARCVGLGRPCMACRGIAPGANRQGLASVLAERDADLDTVRRRLAIYNSREGS